MSRRSKGVSISVYTKPGKVSSLTAMNNTNVSVAVTWKPPVGNFTGFYVQAIDVNDKVLFNCTVAKTSQEVPGLPLGSKITVVVTTLANYTVEGDSEKIITYTTPGPISGLTVITSDHSLTATWDPPSGNYSSFNVKLQGENFEKQIENVTALQQDFTELKSGASYTVVVSAVSGQYVGPEVKHANFTMPAPPSNLRTMTSEKHEITFAWDPPANTSKIKYIVKLYSSFWNYSNTTTLDNKTSHTFSGLKSGTNYSFEVYTQADKMKSAVMESTGVTETVETEISLSMLCSSAVPLLCDNSETRNYVFQQLWDRFSELLENHIVWTLTKPEYNKG
ncbi:receptor-type tyrosine-protein phosphatase H [Pholidichthys leucotaenia]